MNSMDTLLGETPYLSYAYSYPHKTAYRPFHPPEPLRKVWADEIRDALFLYLHVPFCEMRCGFCNLFTTANPEDDLENAYLQTLHREALAVREALGEATFARMAVGGGTPTYLDIAGLTALFDIAEDLFGVDLQRTPLSVETSPQTATPQKLHLLRQRGVDRISIGVQSFIASEAKAAGRGQQTPIVERALDAIRTAGFPTLNLDLIYGLPGQTVESWLLSLQSALQFAPEELYLYPLYVRPLTGLDRRKETQHDLRLDCYRAGRDLLLQAGYEQVSMRMFRRILPLQGEKEAMEAGTFYCCQEDGMVGLGCGARSYTRRLHYSSEYAVGRRGVRAILTDYVAKSDAAFEQVDYGVELNPEEEHRRYVIKSLLRTEGLSLKAYLQHFGSDVWQDLPDLAMLIQSGLAVCRAETLQLTPVGLERSDAIGPWLYSKAIHARMETFELR